MVGPASLAVTWIVCVEVPALVVDTIIGVCVVKMVDVETVRFPGTSLVVEEETSTMMVEPELRVAVALTTSLMVPKRIEAEAPVAIWSRMGRATARVECMVRVLATRKTRSLAMSVIAIKFSRVCLPTFRSE